jgi:predicted component of type VI protein secretion system
MVLYPSVKAMKTTVELPDDLYRRAKAEAALQGRKLKDLVEEGLQLVLDGTRKSSKHTSLAKLMKKAQGIMESGVPDLGSNPKHLENLGRDDRNR